MFEIRKISEKDLPEVEEMYTASVRDNPRGFIQQLHLFPNIRDFIRRIETEGGAFIGVFQDGRVIGMGGLVNQGGGLAEVCKLHVKKEYKGKKYGEKLLSAIEKTARSLNFEKLSLHVTTTQTPAICLYRKFKFRPTKNEVYRIEIERRLYEYDTLYMEKDL